MNKHTGDRKTTYDISTLLEQEEYTIDIKCCARCSQDHDNLTFKKLKQSINDMTHWCTCPTTGEPILLGTVNKGLYDELLHRRAEVKKTQILLKQAEKACKKIADWHKLGYLKHALFCNFITEECVFCNCGIADARHFMTLIRQREVGEQEATATKTEILPEDIE